MKKFLLLFIFFISLICCNLFAETNIDQWEDSEKTYKDLVDEGFEVKAYDTAIVTAGNGLTLMLFITVLQKDSKVFECQEYQTVDENLQTLDLSFICRKIVQPHLKGLGT